MTDTPKDNPESTEQNLIEETKQVMENANTVAENTTSSLEEGAEQLAEEHLSAVGQEAPVAMDALSGAVSQGSETVSDVVTDTSQSVQNTAANLAQEAVEGAASAVPDIGIIGSADGPTSVIVQNPDGTYAQTAIPGQEYAPNMGYPEQPQYDPQYAQPPVYAPQPTYTPAEGYPPATPPAKKKPSRAVILGILAALLLLGILLFGVLGIGRSPEKIVTSAIDATYENLDAQPALFPEYDPDPLAPQQMTMDLSLAESGDIYSFLPAYMKSLRLNMELRTDVKGQQTYFSFLVENPLYNVSKTEVYLTPEEILFRAPNVYSEHDFVSVNLETFPEDWNKSDYSGSSKLSKTVDMPKNISDFYTGWQETIENAQNQEPITPFGERMKEISRKMETNMEVERLPSTKESHVFKVTIPAADFNLFVQDSANAFEDYQYQSYKQATDILPDAFFQLVGMDPEDYMEEMMTTVEEAADMFRGIYVEEPVVLEVHVGKKTRRISYVEAPSILLHHEDSDDVPEIGFDLSFADSKYAMDEMIFNLHTYGEDNTEYRSNREAPSWATSDGEATPDTDKPEDSQSNRPRETVSITHRTPEDKNLVGSRWEVIADTYGMGSPTILYVDYSWNPKERKDNNIALRIGQTDSGNRNSVSFLLTGRLDVDKGKNLSFTNGRLGILQGSREVMALLVEVQYKEIKASEVAPKPKDTVDFFKVDWEKYMTAFAEDLENAMDVLY